MPLQEPITKCKHKDKRTNSDLYLALSCFFAAALPSSSFCCVHSNNSSILRVGMCKTNTLFPYCECAHARSMYASPMPFIINIYHFTFFVSNKHSSAFYIIDSNYFIINSIGKWIQCVNTSMWCEGGGGGGVDGACASDLQCQRKWSFLPVELYATPPIRSIAPYLPNRYLICHSFTTLLSSIFIPVLLFPWTISRIKFRTPLCIQHGQNMRDINCLERHTYFIVSSVCHVRYVLFMYVGRLCFYYAGTRHEAGHIGSGYQSAAKRVIICATISIEWRVKPLDVGRPHSHR